MKKKILVTLSVIACALLLVVGSVAGTLAYLTATASVENTFTVGSIAITMDETDVDLYGDKDADTRVATNEYKLIPGHTYTKDPQIHVAANSEPCYLFVEVANGIAAIETKATDGNTIEKQLKANNWVQIGSTDVWYFNNVVGTSASVQTIVTFGTFTVDGAAVVSSYAGAVIDVTAYAVQSDGFASAEAAWNATFGAPANPNP